MSVLTTPTSRSLLETSRKLIKRAIYLKQRSSFALSNTRLPQCRLALIRTSILLLCSRQIHLLLHVISSSFDSSTITTLSYSPRHSPRSNLYVRLEYSKRKPSPASIIRVYDIVRASDDTSLPRGECRSYLWGYHKKVGCQPYRLGVLPGYEYGHIQCAYSLESAVTSRY